MPKISMISLSQTLVERFGMFRKGRAVRRVCRKQRGRDGTRPFNSEECNVSVPGDSLFNVVTVRCGHCANLLSVNMGSSLQALPHQDPQPHNIQEAVRMEYGSSSRFNRSSMLYAAQQNDQQYVLPLRPPEKRQRVPSAYNRFIKEEIQRIKANNPDISHREAFSAAAKNWAHFPHIHFGLTLESGNQQAALTDAIAAPGGQKAQGIC